MRKPRNLNVLLSKNEKVHYTPTRKGNTKRICLIFLTWELVGSQQQRLISDLRWLEQTPQTWRAEDMQRTEGHRGRTEYPGWKQKAKLRDLTHKNRSQLRYTLHHYKQKWTVVERLNLKVYFLFIYSDINYITTTREIKNSSFFCTWCFQL